MKLPINEQYRISSDVNQWILQKSRTRKGVQEWESIAYYADLDPLVKSLTNRMVRESNATTLTRCISGDRKRHHHDLPGSHSTRRDPKRNNSQEE